MVTPLSILANNLLNKSPDTKGISGHTTRGMDEMVTMNSARKSTRSRRPQPMTTQKMVTFNWEGVSYMLDLERDRVYRNWMAVETNKGFTILGAYRNTASA